MRRTDYSTLQHRRNAIERSTVFMKVSKTRLLLLAKRPYFLLYPEGTPKPFWIDRVYLTKLRCIRWLYLPKRQRARGYFSKGVRLYLHRYVLQLAGKYYPEVSFGNGDPFDCRIVNLKAYRRDEEGASRCLFRNNSTRRKGVCFHKVRKKWVAMIRVHRKLRHLGYFDTADEAAKAYARAWNLAHPTLPPVPV